MTDSISTTRVYQDMIAGCLPLLNSYSTATAIYLLICLCPEDFDVILNLVRLDLSQPFEYQPLLEKEAGRKLHAREDLLSLLQTQKSIVPIKDYCCFWLELTRGWLLSCPFDPDYFRDPETDENLFRQKLRSELVERILNIT